jgi:small subunit ribosomal protein S6
MVIFNADLDEEAIRSYVDTQLKALRANGGEPGYIDYWGKRRFAYRINHRWEGFYVVLQAKAEPDAMDVLHRTLSLADDVIRHKVLRVPDSVYGPPKHVAAVAAAASSTEED